MRYEVGITHCRKRGTAMLPGTVEFDIAQEERYVAVLRS